MSPKAQVEKPATPTNEELEQLFARAKAGDVKVLAQLRQILDESPALWQNYGDLAGQAQASLVKPAAGKNILLSESLMRKLEAMEKELAGESPSALETLLAARIAACWLQTSHCDGLIAQNKDVSVRQAKALQSQQEAAHRRYLSAIQALAKVRKLLTPAKSPIEIATQMSGERAGVRLRATPVAEGVPVAN